MMLPTHALDRRGNEALFSETGEEAVPPVPDGMIRLYRGEAIPSGGAIADWILDQQTRAEREAPGRWFTSSRSEAERYAEDAEHGRVVYLDVPKAVAKAAMANNHPDASKYVHHTKRGKKNDEYFLPKQYRGTGESL